MFLPIIKLSIKQKYQSSPGVIEVATQLYDAFDTDIVEQLREPTLRREQLLRRATTWAMSRLPWAPAPW